MTQRDRFGGWAVVSKCRECAMPIWASTSVLSHRSEPPACFRSCDCLEKIMARMEKIEGRIEAMKR
jgi:hypothetical protein